jgi:hypothetical protein
MAAHMSLTGWRFAAVWILMSVGFPALAPAFAAEPESSAFSAKDRQADLVRLRNFVYPGGFTDQAIIELENGVVPADLAVSDYARLHCGESGRLVLNPCMIRYAEGKNAVYYVITQGGNMRFENVADATAFYRENITDTASQLAMEVDVLNMFVEELCAEINAGARPADILRARGGDRPRINHPIAPTNPDAKYQFSNLFSWERCANCMGIVAVNQPSDAPEPSCGTLRKQSAPNIAYFVIDRTTSRGHRSLDESLTEFTKLNAKR